MYHVGRDATHLFGGSPSRTDARSHGARPETLSALLERDRISSGTALRSRATSEPASEFASTFPATSPSEGSDAFIDDDENHVYVQMHTGNFITAGPDDIKDIFTDGFAGCLLTSLVVPHPDIQRKSVILSHFPPNELRQNVKFFRDLFQTHPELRGDEKVRLRIYGWGHRGERLSDAAELYQELQKLGVRTLEADDVVLQPYHEASNGRGYHVTLSLGDPKSRFLDEPVYYAPTPQVRADWTARQMDLEGMRVRQITRSNSLALRLYRQFIYRVFSEPKKHVTPLMQTAYHLAAMANHLHIPLMEITEENLGVVRPRSV